MLARSVRTSHASNFQDMWKRKSARPITTVVKNLATPLIAACIKCEIFVTNETFFNLSWYYSLNGLYGEGTLERVYVSQPYDIRKDRLIFANILGKIGRRFACDLQI